MTKKHYEAIASIIAKEFSAAPNLDGLYARAGIKHVAYAMAEYFATDNPKFNRDKFLQACGIETKEVTDRVRCNNCMNIYDEHIVVCPKCKSDEYLMQPFIKS